MKTVPQLLTALTLLLAGPAAGAGLRCDGDLVSIGDRMFEVRELCGEPDVAVVQRALHAGHRGYLPRREQWQYNLGPQRQMRFLDFVNKELRRITTGPPGFTTTGHQCDPGSLDAGISRLELLGRCGEPDHKAQRVVREHLTTLPHGGVRREGLPATDWIYQFDGTHFTRVVTLVDGWVVEVEKRDKPE